MGEGRGKVMAEQIIEFNIQQAAEEEAGSGCLRSVLASRADQVARIVDLPEGEAEEKLLEFVIRYIEDAPKMLNDLEDAAEEAGLADFVEPIVRIAREFFTMPPAELQDASGLTSLMYEAYLAHRMLEEVNETYINQMGQPLTPMDMTLSNVIIHTLIGEPFANDLDDITTATVSRLFGRDNPYGSADFKSFISKQSANNLVHIWRKWPSMSGEMGLLSNLL